MYIKLEKLKETVANTEYNRGAIAMLEMIANKQGWEDSETKYFNDFFNKKK